MTPNPHEGQVLFDGKLLSLTARGYCLAEEATGINIPVGLARAEIEGGMPFRLVHAILFGALAAQDRSTSVETVDALIDEQGFNLAALAASQMVRASLPFKGPDAGEPIPQPKP
jgi:hypothetical protein